LYKEEFTKGVHKLLLSAKIFHWTNIE